jgi:hypothetical protein
MSSAVVIPAPESEDTGLDGVECWSAVERIARSGLFLRAARPRDFLLYVSRRILKEGCSAVHEQEIGVAVFGRAQDYDTGQDNIVRVNASELRKRLSLYYASEGGDDPIVIEIPRGSYNPVFRLRAREEPARNALMAEAPPQPQLRAAPDSARGLRLALAGALACIVSLSVACVALALLYRNVQRPLHAWEEHPAMTAFWQPFLAHREGTDVILPDTSLSLIQDITHRPIDLPSYLSRGFLNDGTEFGMSADRRADLGMIAARHYCNPGDFQVAQRIMSLGSPLNENAIRLRFARELTPEAVKINNMILVGGHRSNPWVDLFADRLNFWSEYDIELKQTVICNRAPRSGEQAIYGLSPDASPSGGYCVVAFLPNPGDSANTLIIAGTNSEATNAAGEFFTTERPLAQLRTLLQGDSFPYFEVLLRTKRLDGTPLGAEIVAYRSYPRRRQ